MKRFIKLIIICCLCLTMTACDSRVTGEDIAGITQLPIIYVNVSNGDRLNKLDKVDQDAEFKIVYTDGTSLELKQEDSKYPIEIKGRGNSTWGMPTTKKPYNIKFKEKQDLFGFGEAKKWSLIAGWLDSSYLRSYIGYKLAKTLDETTPDCEMVELVVNGDYEGVYMLCEAYGINKNRVETKGDGKDLNNDGEVTEYLIETDVRALENEEPNRLLTDSNNWLVIKEPDEDEIVSETDERFVYISDYLKKVDQAIVNLDNYDKYIDLDSLASQYIINEYLLNPDWGFGNQPYYASTFMYMEEGGKLYFGPFWDCDIAMGRLDYSNVESEGFRDTANPEVFLAKNTHWIDSLMKDPNFVKLVEEKWSKLKPEVEKMINEIAPAMKEKIALVESYDLKTHDESYEDRNINWGYRDNLGFEDEYNYVINFMKTRLNWLDEQFGK